MRAMRTIAFNKRSRAEILHIEIPGGIVNIRCGLHDDAGNEVTAISISRDCAFDELAALTAGKEGTGRWQFMDAPDSDGMNVRLGLVPVAPEDKRRAR